MKKFFLISSVVFGIVLMLLAVYNFAFRNNVNNPLVQEAKTDEPKPKIETVDTAPKQDGAISVVTDERVLGPVYEQGGDSVLYVSPKDQKVKRVSLDTFSVASVMELSGDPSRVVWSPNKKQALMEMRGAQGVRWYLVDTESKTETVLKEGMEKPVWTSLGDRIVYKYYDSKTKDRSLNIANPDGSEWKKIGESPFKNMGAEAMPQGSVLLFWNQGDAFEETSLQSLSLVGGDAKTLFSGKFGADYAFSPDGQKILMSSSDRKGGSSMMLGLLLNQGGQYKNLNIPTLASKAVWSKNSGSIYYALPGSLPEHAVMPNEYFSKPIFTQDTFWKVNVETGEKKRLVEIKDIARGYDASSMLINDDESMLVFVNRADGKLYRIKL